MGEGRISDLPKEMLQRILYFLCQEEAVRTSALSKSWRYIWATRPNLVFSDDSFKGNHKQNFLSTVDKSLNLCCDQSLCLDEFHLHISLLGIDYSYHELVSLVEKWIPLLTTVVAVKNFRLSIICPTKPNNRVDDDDDLPSVVYEAESLVYLRLHDCNLKNPPANVRFVRLQQLILSDVFIENEILDKIIWSCPLITNLFFNGCTGLKNIKLEKKLLKYLKHFAFGYHKHQPTTDQCIVEIDAPSLESFETLRIYRGKVHFHSLKLTNLLCLVLYRTDISIENKSPYGICIDAPKLKRFHYSPSLSSLLIVPTIIPSISLAPNLRRSKLELFIHDLEDAQSWFLGLSKLLEGLRGSKSIHLILLQSTRNDIDIDEDILIRSINRPVAIGDFEYHIFYMPSYPSVLNGLFCICRPRNITPHWYSLGHGGWNVEKLEKLGEFFRKIRSMKESGNREIWKDLEDLCVEGYDENRGKWQRLEVTALSESSSTDFDRFRVRLQWRD